MNSMDTNCRPYLNPQRVCSGNVLLCMGSTGSKSQEHTFSYVHVERVRSVEPNIGNAGGLIARPQCVRHSIATQSKAVGAGVLP